MEIWAAFLRMLLELAAASNAAVPRKVQMPSMLAKP